VRTRSVELRRGKHYDESVVYDWRTHFLHARLDKLHKDQRRDVALDLGPAARDTFDAFFALRAQPLAPGYAIGLPIYADRRLFELRIEVAAGPRTETKPFGAVDTEHRVSGLRAVLVGYRASAPGWLHPDAPLLALPDRMPRTREGVPLWDPPASVRAARSAAGVVVRDVTSRIAEAPSP
jgi:hypothetical protein